MRATCERASPLLGYVYPRHADADTEYHRARTPARPAAMHSHASASSSQEAVLHARALFDTSQRRLLEYIKDAVSLSLRARTCTAGSDALTFAPTS